MNERLQAVLSLFGVIALLLLPVLIVHRISRRRRRHRLHNIAVQFANTRPLTLPLYYGEEQRGGGGFERGVQTPGLAVTRESVIHRMGALNAPPIPFYHASHHAVRAPQS
ncbi:hypothetical protein PM082_017916 [Marasmius tenuissimus]|nr:hypothetical protein PM082_017916 [Marasmius tenuissimus]